MYEQVFLQHWYWVEGSRMRAETEGEILRAIAQNNGLLIPKAKNGKEEHLNSCLGSGSERHLYSII